MHTGRNAAGGRGRSAAGSSEAAGRGGEGEVRGIGYGSDWECAVVTGYTNAGGGYELSGDESMWGGGLDCGGGGGRCAASRRG